LKKSGTKSDNVNKECSLCREEKEKVTAILSATHVYMLCIACYPRYDSMDNLGKKWMEKEFMVGEDEFMYGK